MKKAYSIVVTDLYEHNMGTMETRTCAGVFVDKERATSKMQAIAIKKFEDLDFPMTDGSEEAATNLSVLCNSWNSKNAHVSKGNEWNYFNALNVPLEDIEELWDNERFYIEILEADLYE